jgi:hypothetical protein
MFDGDTKSLALVVLPAVVATPHNVNLRCVKLNAVAAHTAGDVVDAGRGLKLQMRDSR